MIPLLFSSLLLSLGAPTLGPRPHREQAALLVFSPSGASPLSSSVLVEAAAKELAPRTRLDLHSAEQAGIAAAEVEACPPEERYACWVRAAPESHQWLGLAFVNPGVAPAVTLASIWIDLQRARARILIAGAGNEQTRDALERALYEMAIETPRSTIPSPSLATLRDAFGQIFDGPLAPVWRESGHWFPNGTLEIRTSENGVPVMLDGEEQGRTLSGGLRLSGVGAGEHQLGLGARELRTISIQPDQAAIVELAPLPPEPDPLRIGARYGGLLLAGVGALVMALGVAAAGDSVEPACLVPRGASRDVCRGALPVGTGYDPERAPSADGAVVTRGPGLGALGMALIGGGGGISLGALIGEDHELPLWSLVLGLGAGIAGYALTTLALGD